MGYVILSGLFVILLIAKWKYYDNFTHRNK